MKKTNEQIAAIAFEKTNANVAKNKLIDIMDRLLEKGCITEAEQLEKIIIRLEVWQNK